MLGPQAQLLCVGVTTRQFWLKANAKIGIDFELNPSAAAAGAPSPFDSGALRVNLTALTVTVRAQNTRLRLRITGAGLIQLDVELIDRLAFSPLTKAFSALRKGHAPCIFMAYLSKKSYFSTQLCPSQVVHRSLQQQYQPHLPPLPANV